MNDERPIEKLLHRYAKKRQADAGSPLELHPATRRLLQGEVARQFRKDLPGATPAWPARLLKGWRLQLAWAVPLFALLGVGLWSLLDRPQTQQMAATDLNRVEKAGRQELDARSLAASPDAVPVSAFNPPTPTLADRGLADEKRRPEAALALGGTPYPPAPSGASAAESKRDSTRYGINQPARADKSELVAPATSASGRTSLAARTDVQFTNKSVQSSVAPAGNVLLAGSATESDATVQLNRGVAEPAAARVPEPAASLTRNDSFERESAQTYSQSFANRAPELLKQKKVEAITSAPVSPVLANFRVEQTGRQLRVVDGDGSTYLGEADLPTVAGASGGGRTEPVAQQFKGGAKLNPSPAARTQDSESQLPSNYYRVAGTNRTLNQTVVFTWSYVPMTNPPGMAQSGKISTELNKDASQLPSQVPALLQNSFINGRAQFATGKEIKINAVPVAP